MRKIERYDENPIDNLFLDLSEQISIKLKTFEITPNTITTISLIFGVLSFIALVNHFYITSASLFLMAYFFDCLDGHYARKYNMCTEIGDYYDHVSDILKAALILLGLYLIDKNKFRIFLPYIIVFFVFMMIHINIQEKIYDNDKFGKSLKVCDFLPWISSENSKKIVKFSRFLGSGTFILCMVVIILLYPILQARK